MLIHKVWFVIHKSAEVRIFANLLIPSLNGVNFRLEEDPDAALVERFLADFVSAVRRNALRVVLDAGREVPGELRADVVVAERGRPQSGRQYFLGWTL